MGLSTFPTEQSSCPSTSSPREGWAPTAGQWLRGPKSRSGPVPMRDRVAIAALQPADSSSRMVRWWIPDPRNYSDGWL